MALPYNSADTAEFTKNDNKEDFTEITFVSVKVITKRESLSNGAILLNWKHPDLDELSDEWVPKWLCRNIDLVNDTIFIKTKFLELNKPWMLPEYSG